MFNMAKTSVHAIKRADAYSIISLSSYTRGSFRMSHLDNTTVYRLSDTSICVFHNSRHRLFTTEAHFYHRI
jgi:hypothetical protein